MPVASPYPRHWQCTQCSWKDPLLQHGDALFAPSDRRCPRCGSEITLKKAGLVDRIVFEWKSRKHRKSF